MEDTFDLTTFFAEGVEDMPLLVLDKALELGWLQKFPDGELKRDVSVVMGRDSFELLVSRAHRHEVLAGLESLRYLALEGKK